jgi:excisionase family DNA binding protein
VTGTDVSGRPSAELEPLLSVDDVVRVLGVSESGIYRLVRSGELVRVKVGNRTLFEPAAIRDFIARRRHATAAEDAAMEAHHA